LKKSVSSGVSGCCRRGVSLQVTEMPKNIKEHQITSTNVNPITISNPKTCPPITSQNHLNMLMNA
jgi:hypothetical protein